MQEILKILENLNEFVPFRLDMSGNVELMEKVKKIYE
jgi:hypothetical protein